MENNIYSQENLQRLMQDCITEIKEKLKNTQYADYFNFAEDITIQAKETKGRILGNCHYDSVEYEFDYWGRKRISKIKKATITIFKHEHRNEKGIKETIIHELIHTLKGCQNHKSEFKWHCEIIRSYLGYSCLSGQHDDIKTEEYILDNFKHFLVCTHCNKIVGKSTRLTRPFQHPETRICCTCRNEVVYKNLQQIKEWLS